MMYKTDPIEVKGDIPVFYKHDKYVENYDTIADELIDSIKKSGHNPWMEENFWSSMEQETASMCQKYLKAGDSILDVGCGTGRLLNYFSDVKKYGIDISVEMANMCKMSGVEACMGNVQELPYVDNCFDVVVCTDVLEHVFDLHKTLSEIQRVLKSGGVAVLRVPQNENLEGYLDPNYPFEFVHVRMFSKSSLQLYCSKVFSFSFLEYKHSGRVREWGNYRRFLWIFPRIFTRVIWVLIRQIPGIKDNDKFRSVFIENWYKYTEIIEAFRKK